MEVDDCDGDGVEAMVATRNKSTRAIHWKGDGGKNGGEIGRHGSVEFIAKSKPLLFTTPSRTVPAR